MTKIISVIIPVYNTRKYLQEAIDSVLIQNEYISEIIIIDDGSNDGSGDLLEKLYADIDIIKIFHTKNYGQGHARNLGIECSRGNLFIALILMIYSYLALSKN